MISSTIIYGVEDIVRGDKTRRKILHRWKRPPNPNIYQACHHLLHPNAESCGAGHRSGLAKSCLPNSAGEVRASANPTWELRQTAQQKHPPDAMQSCFFHTLSGGEGAKRGGLPRKSTPHWPLPGPHA